MSKRSDKKFRHREDIKPMPSFKERMLAGQRGESLCSNPSCRKFSKTIMPGGCEHCFEISPSEFMAKTGADVGVGQMIDGESDVHVHGPNCNHDH
jgi:hypothetical protein